MINLSYFLLVIGLILIFIGGYLLKKENKVKGESFQELLEEQNTDKTEYIKLLAGNQGLKIQLDTIEDKLEHISVQLELVGKEQYNNTDCGTPAQMIESMESDRRSVEDKRTSLNLRKGEVRFIQDILEK